LGGASKGGVCFSNRLASKGRKMRLPREAAK
jgi:hypothetical protein